MTKKFIKRMSEDWYIRHEFEYCQCCGEIYDTKYYWYKDNKGNNKLYCASCLAEKLADEKGTGVYHNSKTNF